MYPQSSLKFLLFLICASFTQITYAQEIRVIDNKGTVKTAINNRVYTSPTDPNTPTIIALENDVWINNTFTPKTIKIYNGTAWVDLTHTGTKGSIFFAGSDGVPTEQNN